MKEATIQFLVTVKVRLAEGKPSTTEYVAEDIRQHLEDDSNPGSVYPDDNEYEITSWSAALA